MARTNDKFEVRVLNRQILILFLLSIIIKALEIQQNDLVGQTKCVFKRVIGGKDYASTTY